MRGERRVAREELESGKETEITGARIRGKGEGEIEKAKKEM